MSSTRSKTELIVTTEHELVKQYLEVDFLSRPFKLYTAPVNARTGDPCLVSEMIYTDNVSAILLGKKEGYTTWNTTWVPDSSFTVSAEIESSKTELIVVNENELTKQYQEIDGQNRPVRIYEGPVFMVTGAPCKVTEYIYQSPTSTTIKGKKEGYATWDASWVPDSSFSVDF